ncbi:MAG: hypothetical protein A3F13_08075 [Gammaproteobacteria bacterium RIFCSPHIGHO2_12_FULL_40_19]|nr:MAG: hypothetical protein A3F13_08075 [Gammaproteobacteria bacterium RIFCSPHIGHO2_12_FULL_40_19]
MSSRSNAWTIFLYLLILTGFFFLIEFSLFIQNYRDFLAESSSITGALHLPAAVLPRIVLYLFVQLGLHLGYCLLAWVVSISILRLFPRLSIDGIYPAIAIWLMGMMTILVANASFYPNSKFSALIHIFLFNSFITRSIFILLGISSCSLILLALLSGIKYKPKLIVIASSIFIFIMVYHSNPFEPITSKKQIATYQTPNIIIVGIDALRPDFLGFFGREIATPFMDSFLSHATVFSQALTPLARTFPSWTSILTGRYPREVGIRTNLAQQQSAHLSNSLPQLLRAAGYHTLYATDETRFSNIGTNYGFDHIITPEVGIGDFLFGTINDFPLSNLLVNTSFGRWLFPYSYGNRAAYITYQPNSFLNLLRPWLAKPNNKPLFLAIHFCLPHYPYLSADISEQDGNVIEHYQKSIEEVDKQLRSFFTMLEEDGYLQHALVVLLSDHGEALKFAGDRITEKELFLTSNRKVMNVPQFYPSSNDDEAVNQSAGHGTDVLGLSQYHTLLAFKLYHVGIQQEKIVTSTVSLLDIKPSILDFLKLPFTASSGQSLARIVNGQHEVFLKHHPIFLETDFSSPAIRTIYPNIHQVLLEGINIFEVDPQTLHLVVKQAMNQMIINSKQYAVIDEEWMLALYPQNRNYRMPILINLQTGEWTNDMQSVYAKSSPAAQLLFRLKMFYGEELSSR